MAGLYSRYIVAIYFIGDFLSLLFSSIVCYPILPAARNESGLATYLTFFCASSISWYISIFFLKIYYIDNRSTNLSVIAGLFKTLLLYLLFIEAGINILFENGSSFQKFIFCQLILLSVFVIVWRVLFFYALKLYRMKGFNYRNFVIVGVDERANELVKIFKSNAEYAYRFLGFFETENYRGSESVRRLEELRDFARTNELHEIFCTTSRLTEDELQQVIDFGENNMIRIKFIPGLSLLQYDQSKVEVYGQIPVVNLRTIPLDNKVNKFFKRVFDICFSLFIIVFVLSWLLPLIFLFIKADSKGPVFFFQKRSGIGNRDFWCMKFRTMYINPEANDKQAQKNDARITNVGKFLRRFSIDELPQFFNVLMGDMSVVGPRPHMIKHTEEYASLINKYMIRHLIKPGITGLSQSKGLRGETNPSSMKNRVKVDIFYMENWSFMFDIKIILQTIVQIVIGNNKG